MTLTEWNSQSPVSSSVKTLWLRPTVALHSMAMSRSFWKVINLNMEILKSNLMDMTLHVYGTNARSTENEEIINQSLPLIEFVNSTIKHIIGTGIQLKMIDSLIAVNTQHIVSQMFVIWSSTAEIDNCIFHGVGNMESQDSSEGVLDTAVIFDVEYSQIAIRDCLFENIQVDMSLDVSAALYAENSQVEIYNSNFTKNMAQWAVISGVTSNVTLIYSVFSHNTGDEGASINVQHTSNLQVHNSTFTQNNATYGSGIDVLHQTSVYVTNSVFSYNMGQHGSIDIQQNCSLKIHNSTFTDNKAYMGAGIEAAIQTSVYITGSQFINNHASAGSGIFVSTTSAANIMSCIFRGNSAVGAGASINLQYNSSLDVSNSTFTYNKAQFGGVLVVDSSTANFISCLFKGNSAYQGGALNVQHNGMVSISKSTFIANCASAGGAIAAQKVVRLHIDTSTFTANNASRAGAVLITLTNVNVTMSQCIASKNMAIQYGAVIYADSNTHLMLSKCNLSQNTAPQWTVFYLFNSYLSGSDTYFFSHSSNTIYMKSSILKLHTCLFFNNSLTKGVIIEAEGKSELVLNNTGFKSNKCFGIISASMTPVSINSCRFTDNVVIRNAIISARKALLIMNKSTIHNNSGHENPGILYHNAVISWCTFTNNTVGGPGYGLMLSSESGKPHSHLLMTQSTFLYNQGEVITVYNNADIVLDACNFIWNNADTGTLAIQDDSATLRTSNTTIIAPKEGNKVIVYFCVTTEGTMMTDYLTYNTQFISGNTTLNSSSTDAFLQEAEAAGLVVINKQELPYMVTQEETVFASRKITFFPAISHSH